MATSGRRELIKGASAIAAMAMANGVTTQAESKARIAKDARDYFPGFRAHDIATSGTTIHALQGGSGPPVLLLHGYPQTHLTWRNIAAHLAKEFTVVAADLRGYGASGKPGDGENHSGYSKRAMATDQVELMERLGFPRFSVVGHDRGGRVAHRMALDHADRVERLAVLDIVPTYKLYTTVTKEFATAYFHWFFLIQPAPFPETIIGNSLETFLFFGEKAPEWMGEDARQAYLEAFRDPKTLHAACEDYRASASIDLDHDRADLSRKITCPLLALWGRKGAMGRLFDVVATWRERANNVAGKGLECGHFVPEEAPDALLAELLPFLRQRA